MEPGTKVKILNVGNGKKYKDQIGEILYKINIGDIINYVIQVEEKTIALDPYEFSAINYLDYLEEIKKVFGFFYTDEIIEAPFFYDAYEAGMSPDDAVKKYINDSEVI